MTHASPRSIPGRSRRASSKPADAPGTPHDIALAAGHLLDEVESVARIGSYSLDIVAGSWVSSTGLDAILGIDVAFERSVEGWASLVHPADRAAMSAYFADEVIGRRQPFEREYRIVRQDTGEERWVHGRGALEFDASGRPVRMLGTIADITEPRSAREALVASELRYAAIFEGAIEAILVAEVENQRLRWVNPAACAMFGYTRDELLGLTIGDLHPEAVLPSVLGEFDALADEGPGVGRSIPCRRKDGTILLADIRGSTTTLDGVPCNIGFFSDVTELRRLEAQDRRLVQAVEHTSDSVIITDRAGTIEYVNPAFERVSGYRSAEAIGQTPRLLKSGRQSAALYRALWRRLTRGQSWAGTLVNRRKDGSHYEEEATISPIRDPDGEITGYIAVKRDVTALRAAETGLAAEFRERAEVAAALARLQPGPSAEATAADICDELVGLPGMDLAAIINFLAPGRGMTIAVTGPDGIPLAPGRPLPDARAAYLHGRAAQGPWAEAWRPRPVDGRYGEMISEVGIRAIAYAPIRNGDRLLGLVAAGTLDETYARHLIDHLPVVGEFAATASALLGDRLEQGHRDAHLRERITRVLAEHAFSPMFQPVIDLASGRPVGYEALTRFADGTPPDQMIGEAHAVGLGHELEIACLAAALDAAEPLPADVWLSLNASPDVILHSRELARLLQGRSSQIVLEVTEHVEIGDYRAVRRAVAAAGPGVRLAVDDAGAGFASLRHILELGPRFIKLDRALICDVDRDPARQAMIDGLAHFGRRVGSQVIAEGIERAGELDMLRELGVPLGQGFLIGRPLPFAAVVEGARRSEGAWPGPRTAGQARPVHDGAATPG